MVTSSSENGESSDESFEEEQENNALQVFPPNMPYKLPYIDVGDSTPRSTFGFEDFICMTIRMRLDCRVVNREGVVRARYNVLNEVVIDRGSSPYLCALECFCDDVHLTTVQADGVIFATPSGSTAYSMAAGGSVVHPAVPCILVTPICPHVLSFRSMVFPDHVVLRCFVPDDARSTASVAFDGKQRCELQRGDSVQIQMSAYPVPTINKGDHSSDWLESLKRSFNFNTRPRQKPLPKQKPLS
ncbi:ATP-NAD kinase [Fragilariopsis cylindrus CCMP1102]|uniref:ATP-NAD kinase n=1 Tax=Fragilariopsis cylindrus CCMP1102 TaxID=635003 RepID=A0A1E7FPB1_9STRA|nr:ATP-NAD kinase [Fragilariopsis cylindrus CCMP1102]|eukprot:OEU19935.1 ATP-NAD kinase [Fragilariopsis cylindrus CCMP1102]